jgi:glutaredoxin
MCRVISRAYAACILLALLPIAASMPVTGEEKPLPAEPATAHGTLRVYVRDGCPHCADAKTFLAQLAIERPDLRIVFRNVNQDPEASAEWQQLSRNAGVSPPGVPTFVIDGRVMVGFDDAQHSGPLLLGLIDQVKAPANEVESTLFGTLSAARLGLPLFTLALGLLDGFNPCATWVLLFLLSLLVRLHDRKRMALIAGTFVLASGAVYYAFMAAWLNIFLMVGMSDILRLALAGVALVIGAVNVKDFVAWGRGPSLSIQPAAKPGIYARMRGVLSAQALPASLGAVIVLAVAVNFFELLCTAGIPAIYTAVLTQHHLSAAAHYAYLALYILGYMADDILMVTIAVIALSSFKLTEYGGRWLKLLSGTVMLALGYLMAFHPEWML